MLSNAKKYLDILKKLTDKSNLSDSRIDLLELNLKDIHVPKDGAKVGASLFWLEIV